MGFCPFLFLGNKRHDCTSFSFQIASVYLKFADFLQTVITCCKEIREFVAKK